MKDIIVGLWEKLVEYYGVYSDMIHSIAPSALGDLIEGLIDLIVIIAILKIIADAAFGTKGGNG